MLLNKTAVEASTQVTSPPRRCPRASRLHSPEQLCTPVGYTHEGDVSDVESCCSIESGPISLTRSRRKKPRVLNLDDDVSEVDSCSSAVSPPGTARRTRLSTRNLTSGDPAKTASLRKSARTRSAAKQPTQTGDSELSDTDSHLSSVSGADASSQRRATRSRRPTRSIPIHLDEAAESSVPSTPTRRSSRTTTRGRSTAPVSDSEGHSVGKSQVLDSDSEPSLVGRATPCSSRTGSGSSGHDAPSVRRSARQLSIARKRWVEPLEDDAAILEEEAATLDNSQLENTVIGEDAECTLVEEEQEEAAKEPVERADKDDVVCVSSQQKVVCISEEEKNPPCDGVDKPAAATDAQQGEPCEDEEVQSSLEMEATQETSSAPEKAESSGAAAVTDVQDSADSAETPASEEDEATVVSMSPGNRHQAPECSNNVQVMSNQQAAAVTVESSPQRQPADAVAAQNNRSISLLDSSEEEEEDEEEVEEELVEVSEEETPGPSGRPGAEMGGMFMIDTRPGQDADEDYYMTKEAEGDKAVQQDRGEERGRVEEEEEEFVDEAEEEDDETTNMLYSSRNPLV